MLAKELQELGGWKIGQECLLGGSSLNPDSIVKVTRITDGRDGTIYVGDTAFDTHGSQRGGDICLTAAKITLDFYQKPCYSISMNLNEAIDQAFEIAEEPVCFDGPVTSADVEYNLQLAIWLVETKMRRWKEELYANLTLINIIQRLPQE